MPYIGQRPSKGDENNFKILDDISSYTLTFDGSDSSVVSAANETITSLTHRFVQGQRVTYNNGGGSNIAGLTSGTVYYIIKEDHNTIKLATSASNASNGVAVNITGVGGGSSHTLNVAFDGTNTKFKATHTNGQKAKITRSAQLVISMNGVIQQPHDTATPSTGFGFDLDGTIVFSQAPVSTDIFWAHVLTNNNVTFDISDNDIDNFTGDGSTTEFNLSKSPPDNRNVLVTIDGVVQYPNDPDGTARAYVVVENVLTFNSAPASGVEIQVRHIGFAGSSSASGGVTNFYGRTGSVVLKNTDNITVNDAAVTGNLTVDGNFTANGDFTTLNTTLREVELLRVDAQNDNVAAGIITQRGSGDILNLYDGSTEVFSVVDGGNVGITTSIFHLNDTDTKITFPSDNDKVRIELGGLPFAFSGLKSTSGSAHARWGINVATPSAVLHIDEVYNHQGLLRVTNGNQNSGYYHQLEMSGNNNIYTLWRHFDGTSMKNTHLHGSTRHAWYIGGNEKVRIHSDGNVGIGSQSPTAKLDVGGDVKVGSGITFHATNSRISLPSGTTGGPYTGNFEIGNNRDFTIVHDSNHLYMTNRTGNFYIGISDSVFPIRLKSDNTVEIFHGSTKTIETASTGITVTGVVVNDGIRTGDLEYIMAGNSGDIAIYHDSNGSINGTAGSSYIKCQGVHDNILNIFTSSATGKINLKSNNNAKTMLSATGNGAVELYHNDNLRFSTTDDGITVDKGVTINGIEGGDAQIRLRADQGDDNNDMFRFVVSDGGTGLHIQGYDGSFHSRILVDTSGKVCIAHANALHSGKLQVSTSSADAIDINAYSSTAANGGRLTFYRSKNATIGSNTIVADNDSLGRIDFRGYNTNGNSYNIGATIEAEVDGSVNSSTDMPSAIVLKTSADGSASPTERLRILSGGNVGIGTAIPAERLSVEDSSPAILINATSATGESKLQFGRLGNTNVGEIKYEHSNNAFTFRTNDGADRLRITSAGQVQINTDGGSGALTLGASQDFRLYHDANGPTIFSDTGNQGLKLQIKELNLTEYTGVTTRLKITSDGNIGINDSAPPNFTGYKSLSIHGSTGGALVFGDDGTDEWEIYGGDGVFKIYDRAATTTRLHLDGAYGRFGINSSSFADTSTALVVRNGRSDSDHTMLDIICNDNETARIMFSEDSNHGKGQIRYTYTGDGNYMSFYTNGTASGNERLRITSTGRVLIGDSAATSLLSVGGSNYNWNQGDTPMVLIKGHNNEAPTSGSENIAFQIEDENNNLIHKVWNTGGGNSDYGIAYYAGKLGINDTSPTTKVNIKIGTSTQWDSTKNVSNTTNLNFLALDLINTDNNTNSEVGLMMEAGSSSAAQMTISTKKVSANYAELAIRTRDGGSASKEIWKLRGNGDRYVRGGATIDIEGGAKDANITPNNGDYIDFARVNYAGAAMGEIFIKWTSVVAPACCHHGSAHLRIGTEYHTYFYGWNDWVDVISSAAHNSGWFSHWRLRRVVVSGTSYLYLQGKWNGSNVSAGNFQVVIGKTAYHPSGGGFVEALTPVVDNNENGDTSGSKTYMAVQAQVQGKREKDSPAVSGDRITKSHSGRFHAYLGLSSHGEISAYNQPRMSANKNAGQTYTTTPTIVTYGNEHFDNGNDYNPSTSTYTCPMDGVYYVSYSTNVDAYSNWQYLECRVNGSAAFTHTRIMHLNFPRLTLQGSNFVNCAQGDEIAIYGWVGSGTNGGDNFGLFQVYMLS